MTSIRVAFLVCTNVLGGHEFQAVALCHSLAEHSNVTVFVNRPEHAGVFQEAGLDVRVAEGLLLGSGTLPRQYFDGWRRRITIRALVESFDHVIVSAGAVEAGVAAGVALRGYQATSMYLPSFYDRVPVWGWKGHLYNCILGSACKLFDRIITINRIQARVIRAFSGVQTLVIANRIRQIQMPVEKGAPRLIFIGRMDHQKRVDELMRWLDVDSNPIKELVLMGDGPLLPLLEGLAKRLTYLNCSFLGWTKPEDQDLLIRASDVLVLNSLIEGEPLVIREARARGMNILARKIVGIRGVTSQTERFSTQQELLDRLVTIASRVGLRGEKSQEKSPSRVNNNREEAIKVLLQEMAKDCRLVKR